MKAYIYAAALLSIVSTGTAGAANANPIATAALADAAAKAAAAAEAEGGKGGDGTGGGGGSATSKDDSTTVAAALGQAQSALSVEGVCGKDNRFAFGALQWSDYSSKCFNYQIALIAAQKGDWNLANQWVKRADGM